MGCNTSKESAPQNEGQENEITNDKTGNNENKEEANHVTESADDEKSASAKTITIRTNSCSANKPEVNTLEKAEPDQEQEQAAVKIQAAFRGHQTRKSMKQAVKPNNTASAPSEPEPTQKELEAEFRADDAELCNAATKIQASFRGHMTRKQIGKEEGGTTPSRENQGDQEELDIDLSDPDLNKAAVKIQASFRGHMVRKDNEGAQ